MERCPNCGTPSRPGARFCTTCGARFAGNDEDVAPAASNGESQTAPVTNPNGTAEDPVADGWPPAPAAAAADEGEEPGWPRASTSATANEPGVEAHDQIVEVVASTWSGMPEATWPSPAADDPAPIADASPAEQADMIAGEATAVISAVEGDPANSEAHLRAVHLLDDLRDAIALLGDHSRDLSGVIAELEVAVTPPGALESDDLAELRSALLAARERPRDVDTIVDLTHRVDAIVALVFAYDRTIAAIERALVILRGK